MTSGAQHPHRSAIRRWYRPMTARDTDENHRAATPLELFFDLCFVVAVSQAAARLHHALSAGELAHGIVSYLMVFFAIWWAWVNFTWFASAYDTDDGVYRITTFVQITGALILAAGVPGAFDSANFTVVVVGYVVMRLAMVGQWLRAAYSDPDRRRTALRFAIGITITQVGWVARLALPSGWALASFLFLVVCEMLVPILSERAGTTTWHAEHIAERYSLFTLIVLGEAVLAATTAVQAAFAAGGHRTGLLVLTGAGLLIVFAMWWLYFDRPGHEALSGQINGFLWGYGHYLVFASAAALGTGIVASVDVQTHEAHLSGRGASFAIAVPLSIYLISVWFLHRRPNQTGVRTLAFPITAVLVLLAPFGPTPAVTIAVIVVALVTITGLVPASGDRRGAGRGTPAGFRRRPSRTYRP